MSAHGVDAVRKMAADHEASAGGKFIKLADDGDKIVCAFLGEPFAREVVWVEKDGKRLPEEYDEKEHGPTAKAKPKMSVSWNVYDFDAEIVRVLEKGVTFFRTWLQADEKYGRSEWAFEVKRNGKANSTKTTYACFPDRQLNDEEKKLIAGLDLYDLEDGTDSLKDGDEGGKKSGGVIDPDTANTLIAGLKDLRDGGAPDVVAAFLAEFGVEAIRDVPAALGEKALAFVTNANAKKPAAAPAEKPAEKDPFA